MNSKFPDRIKELRTERGLSQGALATALKYTQSNVSEWEQGRVEPKISALRAIANYFNVSIDYLAGLTDELGAVVMPSDMQLSDSERELLLHYRQLRPDLQRLLLSTAKTWTSTPIEIDKKIKENS